MKKQTYEDTSFEHEKVLEQMVDLHGMQVGQILNETLNWLRVHRPEAFEEYTDGSEGPIFFYGHKDLLKSLAKSLTKK